MKRKVRFFTERLVIKTMQIKDITLDYIRGLNDSEVNKFLVGVRIHRQTVKRVKEYVLSNLHSPQDIMLSVYLKKERVFIGTIRIAAISNFHYSCTVGICFFNKKYWKQGYALEALDKTVEFIFKGLNLHHIEAGVYSDNFSSMKLFKRAGFTVEAVYQDRFRYLNEFKEVSIFGKTNPDFNYTCLKKIRSKD